MSKAIEQIKKNMAKAEKDIISSFVITKICIKRLEESLKESQKLLNQFKV